MPLDNMITRDTARFVGSKDPDYLTSVFQVRCRASEPRCPGSTVVIIDLSQAIHVHFV